MNEQWREVEGWPYEVSDQGRVRRTLGVKGTRAGHILTPNVGDRYPVVALSKGGKPKRFRVHVLVAAAFLGPRPAGFDVNHINGDKTDNRAANLEYVDRSGNLAHAAAMGLSGTGENRYNSRLTEADVRRIRDLAAEGRLQREIAEEYGLIQPYVSKIIRGERWGHFPYRLGGNSV
jgi:hypothetical protein